MDTDYSVLEASVVQGYDPKDQDYSHLEPGRFFRSTYNIIVTMKLQM